MGQGGRDLSWAFASYESELLSEMEQSRQRR